MLEITQLISGWSRIITQASLIPRLIIFLFFILPPLPGVLQQNRGSSRLSGQGKGVGPQFEVAGVPLWGGKSTHSSFCQSIHSHTCLLTLPFTQLSLVCPSDILPVKLPYLLGQHHSSALGKATVGPCGLWREGGREERTALTEWPCGQRHALPQLVKTLLHTSASGRGGSLF